MNVNEWINYSTTTKYYKCTDLWICHFIESQHAFERRLQTYINTPVPGHQQRWVPRLNAICSQLIMGTTNGPINGHLYKAAGLCIVVVVVVSSGDRRTSTRWLSHIEREQQRCYLNWYIYLLTNFAMTWTDQQFAFRLLQKWNLYISTFATI